MKNQSTFNSSSPMRHYGCIALFIGLAAMTGATHASQIPQPIRFADIPSRHEAIKKGHAGQITSINVNSTSVAPALSLETPVGNNYTLTFWVRAENSPLLEATDFSYQTPVTLVDFASHYRDDGDRRMIIRIMGGHFNATEQNDQEWGSLKGFDIEATPGQWFFLVYLRTPEAGMLYVDGNRVAQTDVSVDAHNRLASVVFGNFNTNFNALRPFTGLIVEPRLYGEALTDAQIQSLAKTVPAAAQ